MTSLRLFQRRFTRLCAAALVGGFALFSFSGCDSLDVANPNAPEPEVVSIQALATGLEGGLRAGMGVYWRVNGIFARDLYYFEPADPRYTGELYTGPLDPGGFLLLTPWSGRYRAIGQARILIEQAEARGLGEAEQAGIRGYANTLIAHQLLLALNYLGENGIKIEFSDQVDVPFVTQEEGYAEINRYLDEALTDLQSAGDAFPFSLSGGFAGFDTPAGFAQFNRAIRARVAIYQGDAGAALSALEGSFISDGDLNGGVYHTFGAGSGDRLNPMFEVPTADFVKLRATPEFVADAEAGDQRVASKVLDRGEELPASPGSANGLASSVVVTTASSSSGSYPVIRNEELLLIRAEANILNGDLDAAETDINAVRSAAGLGNVELDDENALDQLLFERRYSLFAEGHRWVDLRRYDRLGTLPTPEVGEGITSQIFEQWPRPNSEVPG
ncbi:MAG: RagB/SusD family nutrient uptake outer membrane protein [Bacteroidota bacterium]